MKLLTLTAALILFSGLVFSQQNSYRVIKQHNDAWYATSEIVFDNPVKLSETEYHFSIETPIPFSCFGVGWNEPVAPHKRGDFIVHYRVSKGNGKWNDFKEEDAFVTPDETPTGLYWTNVLFGMDEYTHSSVEFFLTVPAGCHLSEIHVVFNDLSRDVNPAWVPEFETADAKNCPVFPSYIPRSTWCGGYTACHNPTYTVSYINPTHTVIHHGASPDTYTDGAAVARSYWNYHVNTLGWNDIGYNYLTDQWGNLYQGRHNTYLNATSYRDVLGAHAGASNSSSIGVNFMGNADVTLPTTVQLEKCEQLLAWWYSHYGFDPTSSATIVLQSGGSASKYRICGHKDVNVGGTSCPGTTLYGLLPSIRTATKAIIDACSTPADVTAPSTAISVDGNVINDWRGTDFWTDFSDYDNSGGSGVENSFYQVIDYNGSEWRCNAQQGFFNDNFTTAIHPDWAVVSGTWAINASALQQSDEAQTNPNIYASCTQTSGYNYLYHFQGKMSGTGTNRRFGFFFFCSDGSQTYRGEAYMIYFRADDGRYEVYKSSAGSISGVLAQANVTISPNTWYDYKVTYNPSTGVIKTYINGNFIGSYTDPSPLQSGNHISLRTGGCIGQYDDFKVRRTRDNRELVTVGSAAANQVRYESPSVSQDACRINTVVNDLSGNWSPVVAEQLYIDWTKPVTSSSVANTWQTQDFQVDFTDEDNVNGSGISRRFYQVIDFNGNEWRANAEAGFYSDNFDGTLHSDWTSQTGTWAVVNNELVQSNETLTNTNLWAYLKQDLSNRYLYEFAMKIEGAGTNRRAGFHFMCDDATLTNRGNSYFVWFRVESQTLEFYKVYNDVFEQEKVLPCNIQAGTTYNIKVVFDRITGETFVYIDDKLAGEWKDDSPFSTGNYISFRSGNSKLTVNNLKVYRTRTPQVNVTVGSPQAYIRYENTAPGVPAAKVKSIVTDNAHNLSDIYYHELNVDWTAPYEPLTLNDGLAADIDTSWSLTQMSANWTQSADSNSGLEAYWYAIGTTAYGTDVVGWTNNGTALSFTHTGLSLYDGQIYYVSVKAENGAGLMSSEVCSNGQVAALGVSVANAEQDGIPRLYPNPASDMLNVFAGAEMHEITLLTTDGKVLKVIAEVMWDVKIDLKALNLPSGQYLIHVSNNKGYTVLPFVYVK
jgi:hypothetical protein